MKETTYFMRRTFILLLILVTSVNGWAVSFTVDGINYNITDANGLVVAVTSSTPKYQGSVTIPATVTYNGKNYSVKAIGENAFKQCTDLTSVTIGSNIETVGYAAFSGCTNLTEINWSNNIKKLDTYAFNDCSALTHAELSSSLEEMGVAVFSGCINITSATINDGCAVVGKIGRASCRERVLRLV